MTLRLLLVDGDPSSRRALTRALAVAQPDAEVVQATDCPAAVAVLSSENGPLLDCVLLDHRAESEASWSHGAGRAVFRAARARAPRVPVVMVTGAGDGALAVELMKQGASDCIPLPQLTPARLAQSLRQVVLLADAERRERDAADTAARQAAQLAQLVEAGVRIHTALSVEGALSCVAAEARSLFAAVLSLAATESETSWSHAESDPVAADAAALFDELAPLVPRVEGVLRLDARGVAGEPRLRALAERVSRAGFRVASWLAVPLRGRDGARLGALHLARSDGGFSESEASLLSELAHTASIALENARLYRAAEDAMRARDDVLAIVSHDLRAPLNNVALSASLLGELLDDSREDTRKERIFVRRINAGVTRMKDLIADLLELSRIEAGTLRVKPIAVRGAALLDEGIEAAMPLAEAKGCRLERGEVDATLEVLADRERIAEVFASLLGNAVRFAQSGSRITMSVARDGGFGVFSVADDGAGIAAGDLPGLFDSFWKAPSGTRIGGSAGLGLFIARGIVQAHGGQVQVESQGARGVTVRFRLPIL